MSAAHFNAAIPQPFRILGLTLRPFSLGRYRILRGFNCAFVSEESAIAKPADLILGVLACSMEVDEFLELVNNGKLCGLIQKWGKKVFGRFKPKPFDYFEKVQLFSRYLAQASEVPKYWEEDIGEPSGGHWSQSMEVGLRSELNWTREEINEQPIGKAIADYYKWLENKGAIRLMTDWEIKIIEDLEKANANN